MKKKWNNISYCDRIPGTLRPINNVEVAEVAKYGFFTRSYTG